MHSAENDIDRPALTGGVPVRPAGPPDWPFDDPAVAEALARCVRERTWGKYHGPNCLELIETLVAYHDCSQAVLCASGTAAVELALRALNVRAGDEVILAAYEFKGNFQNVLTVGATPVLVDLDPDNWNLDPTRLAEAVSPATKAVLVSHLHGGVVPMPAVMEFAAARGLPVIEDACQMPGAVVCDKRAGTWGDVGVLSFGGSKLLSAGRGGALLTNREDVVQRSKLYTLRGNDAYPLSELQAAVVVPQLKQLDEANRIRSRSVRLLEERLAERPGLRPFRNKATDSQPGYYKLGFQYDAAAFAGLPRDVFAQAMRAEGIAVDPGFRSLHAIHSPRRFRKSGELPQATQADQAVLTLHHPILQGREADVAAIVQALDKIRRSANLLLERYASS
jgi:perosamine synthetase